MRLIDADALKEKATLRHGYDFQGVFVKVQDIDKAPTIEAAPVVHGRWVLVKPRRTGRNATYKCTACGQLRSSYYNDVTQWKHCPCGAIMDGDSKAPTTPTTNHRVCKHCKTAVIGMEEYADALNADTRLRRSPMPKKPNPYLAKQQAMMQSAFEIGEEMGMQRMWDYVQIALRCPEVMGKDTVGNTRMKRLYKKNGRACQRVPGRIHPRSRSRLQTGTARCRPA